MLIHVIRLEAMPYVFTRYDEDRESPGFQFFDQRSNFSQRMVHVFEGVVRYRHVDTVVGQFSKRTEYFDAGTGALLTRVWIDLDTDFSGATDVRQEIAAAASEIKDYVMWLDIVREFQQIRRATKLAQGFLPGKVCLVIMTHLKIHSCAIRPIVLDDQIAGAAAVSRYSCR